MTRNDRDVHLPDGRVLRIREEGALRGHPVFVLHGTPGGRLIYPVHARDAERRGLRLIGYDRPGYGGSTRKVGRRTVDAASDVRAIADDLGIERFGVWGHSGGGAPALACAAKLKGRAVAVAALAAAAPFTAEGFDPYAGMGELNVTESKLLLADRPAFEQRLRDEAEAMQQQTAAELVDALATLLSDIDRSALTSDLAAFLQAQIQAALGPSADGWIDDCVGDIEPWGFEPSEVGAPLQLWHGDHDRFVPASHGQWLADHLPGAEVHLEPNEGHLTLYAHRIPDVHEWIAAHF